jgi:hypothetical protein
MIYIIDKLLLTNQAEVKQYYDGKETNEYKLVECRAT